RHELANENNAALVPLANIVAQVHLSKVAISRPRYAEHPRVEELKGDDAHEGLALALVEGETGRQPFFQQRRRHAVGGEEEVAPARGKEGKRHGRLLLEQWRQRIALLPRQPPKDRAQVELLGVEPRFHLAPT